MQLNDSLQLKTVALLFKTLKALFLNKLSSELTNDDSDKTIRIWYRAFVKLGLTDELARHGFEKLPSLNWPPSCPKDFYDLCFVDDGLPRHDDGYRLLVEYSSGVFSFGKRQKPVHPVIYETGRRIGLYKFQHTTAEKARAAFDRVYPQVVAEYRAGHRFTVPETHRIEQTPSKPTSREDALKKIQALKRVLIHA